MTGYDYEHAVAEYLKQHGFHDVEVTKASGDYGVDIIAEKDFLKYAIQCKYYSNPVGIAAVQEVAAGRSMYGCTVAMVVTNSTFTPAAENLAKANGVVLMSGISGVPETIGVSDENSKLPKTYPESMDTSPVSNSSSTSESDKPPTPQHLVNHFSTPSVYEEIHIPDAKAGSTIIETSEEDFKYRSSAARPSRRTFKKNPIYCFFRESLFIFSVFPFNKLYFWIIHIGLALLMLSEWYERSSAISDVILIIVVILYPFWIPVLIKRFFKKLGELIALAKKAIHDEIMNYRYGPRRFYVVSKRRNQFVYKQTKNHEHELDISPITALPCKFTFDGISYNLDNLDDIEHFPLKSSAFYINGHKYHFNDYFRLCAQYYKDAGYIEHAAALAAKANRLEIDHVFGKELKRAGHFYIRPPQ